MEKTANTLKESRRETILEAAAELLAVKPAATLQEIADAARVGVATLHRHFESREKMMLELAVHSINLVDDALQGLVLDGENMEKTLGDIFEVLIPLGNRIYFLWMEDALCNDASLLAAQKRIEDKMLGLIQDWQEKGSLRKDMAPEWILFIMNNLLYATWQSIHDGKLARKAAPGLLVQTLVHGFSGQ